METRNTIEDKIEREHFEFCFCKMMEERIKISEEREKPLWVLTDKRDYSLMKDYFGIGVGELTSSEISDKYGITISRVNQIVARNKKIYFHKMNGGYFKKFE